MALPEVLRSLASLRVARQGHLMVGRSALEWTLILVLKSAAAAAAKSLQSCPTLCGPKDGSPPGSLSQAGTLEWVAISFSNA